MKQKFFFVLAALMMLMGTSAMAQSDTLKGDVNGDGVVDVADIAAVIAVMAKEAEGQPAYYWYVGLNKPTTSTDPTTELATADDAMGWHKIGSLLGTYSKGSPLWAGASQGKVINLNPDYDDVTFYVALPVGIGIYDGLGNEVTHKFTLVSSDVYIAGRNYNVYSDLNSEFGLLLYSSSVSETKYYWYAGQSQPTSLTSNPTPSAEFTCNNWFEIGTELPTSITQRVTGGVSGQGWYVALPSAANLRPTTSDKVTLDTSVKKAGTITVNNIQYDVWDLAGNTVTRLNPSFYK